MKFDLAIQALGSTAWDWSEAGFASIATRLGLTPEADTDPEMPVYESPWGKEWVQAIVEEHEGARRFERVEFLVEDTSPRWRPFTSKKLVALGRKYRDKLAAYVKRASAVLGEPAFYAEYGTTGWPDDEDAHALAMWKREGARLMVMTRNEGPDTPFWISIVIKPLAQSRAATARPSRPVMRAPTRQSSPALEAARFDAAIEMISKTPWKWSAPALADIVEKLPIRANASESRIELVVEAKQPPTGGFDEDDMERLFDDYLDKYRAYVARAERVLGKPKYNDGMGLKGCPKDEQAQMLALWPLKTARVMVLLTNESETTPYAISIVVRPR